MINSIHSVEWAYDAKAHSPTFRQRVIARVCSIAVVAIRIMAKFFSIFGGKTIAKSLRGQANRIQILHVHHNLLSARKVALPLLAPAHNLARRDCILKREDIAAAQNLRERYLKQQNIDPVVAKKVKQAVFKGAQRGGICFGGTYTFLKAAKHAKSEQELKEICRGFEKGLPAEAAGLQALYSKRAKSLISIWAEKAKAHTKKLYAELKPLKGLSKKEWNEKLGQVKEKFAAFKREQIALVKQQAGDFSSIISLLGLRREAQHDLGHFDTSSSAKSRLNLLPKGSYHLSFAAGRGRHAIAFLKKDFGTYFFDPNYGLMKSPSNEPSKDLVNLLNKYRIKEKRAMCAFAIAS